MDWGDALSRAIPLLVGLGGFALAAYQARVNREDRREDRRLRLAEQTASYRQHLFEKQLDAYVELAAAVTNLFGDAVTRLTAELATTKGKVPMTPTRRFELRGEIMPTWTPLILLRQRYAIVWSDSVTSAVSAFEKAIGDITAPPSLPNPPELALDPDPSGALGTRYTATISAIRDALGVEPLTAATLRAVSEASKTKGS